MNKTEKKWAVGMLYLGIVLGIVGSLVANALDRYFIHYGTVYDIVVTLAFVFTLWWVNGNFTKFLNK